mmetsp:Transcript_11198/g.27014  ORF Transcript_11198/g.27014 Transcript_11198/m.27014 type:complete len:239 (+) Transcript_11198:449-1165(+)
MPPMSSSSSAPTVGHWRSASLAATLAWADGFEPASSSIDAMESLAAELWYESVVPDAFLRRSVCEVYGEKPAVELAESVLAEKKVMRELSWDRKPVVCVRADSSLASDFRKWDRSGSSNERIAWIAAAVKARLAPLSSEAAKFGRRTCGTSCSAFASLLMPSSTPFCGAAGASWSVWMELFASVFGTVSLLAFSTFSTLGLGFLAGDDGAVMLSGGGGGGSSSLTICVFLTFDWLSRR